jgi:hypothetical protein
MTRSPGPPRRVPPGHIVQLDFFGSEWGLVGEPEYHHGPGSFPFAPVVPHGDDEGWERVVTRPGARCRCTGDESPLVRVERRLWRTSDGRRWLQDEKVTGAPHHRARAGAGWYGHLTTDFGAAEDISHLLVGS